MLFSAVGFPRSERLIHARRDRKVAVEDQEHSRLPCMSAAMLGAALRRVIARFVAPSRCLNYLNVVTVSATSDSNYNLSDRSEASSVNPPMYLSLIHI